MAAAAAVDMLSLLREIPEALILIAAVIVALGVIWAKAIKPVRDWVREFKQWMHRTGAQLEWVDTQMRPNHGSSLVDKVNMAATKMIDTDEKVDQLTRSVALLLHHDAERDQPGRRYGVEDDKLAEIEGGVEILLEHDATRDVPGLRFESD